MRNFQCSKCNSSKLSYQQYVKCTMPVQIQHDGTIYYSPSIINEDHSLGVNYGFCCADCGTMIYHRSDPLQTEGELIWYLSLSEDERQRQENEYFEQIRAQQDYEEQQRREFDELISQNIEE